MKKDEKKNVLNFLAIFILMLWGTSSFASNGRESFSIGNGKFILNGEPFIIKAAELHYPRIPRPYWEHRIKMCKALGMNTICLYVFWNIHEQKEGEVDFTGNNDVAEFIRLIQKNGLYVIVRPGPYVCAEWEMGGLPWWLLKKKDIRLRENDPYFIERYSFFAKKLGEQIGHLTIDKGGPIIMVQVENEYGAYGTDKSYMSAIRDIIRKSGFEDILLFQCDWGSNFIKNGLDDLLWTLNFGSGANIDSQFKKLIETRPTYPLMCSEYWSGWFDKWGRKHERHNADIMINGLKEMLDKNISFSLYMTHGGTSWWHWAGANSPGFSPDVTSYDYDAPINEAGQVTPKYIKLRGLLEKYSNEKLPSIPKEIPLIKIPPIKFNEFAPFFENLPQPKKTFDIKSMEMFDQGWGSILYRTFSPSIPEKSVMRITDGNDFVQVFINGKFVGSLDRRNNEKNILIPPLRDGDCIDILVEAMGRINYGRAIKDFKGITEKVELSYKTNTGSIVNVNLKNWLVYNWDDCYSTQKNMKYIPIQGNGMPGCYRAKFNLRKVGDTFLNMEKWGKGQVYVNGHAIGRFWRIGPQQTLYMPGCWLKKGENEIIIQDISGPEDTIVEGLDEPIIDKLNILEYSKHRKEGQSLDLSGEIPCASGEFLPGNGWQEVIFDKKVRGRYVCIEAIDSHGGKEYASIAEWYMLDEYSLRLNRESWSILYADDEDIQTGNKTADRIFDLQESTYWSTNKGIMYPHHIIIDLGCIKEMSGFQYLPRVESGAPGSIKSYNIYVKDKMFSIK